MLAAPTGSVGGMVQAVRESNAEVVPLMVATTCPGGPLTSECYRQLKSEFLEYTRAALPVQGVLLSLHGSATVEDIGDLEGDLLQSVRAVVGTDVPIVATLDPHAHVTQQMVQNADALVGWETYPHIDAHESGIRATRLLFDIIAGRVLPTMALAKVPVLVSGVKGQTDGDGPFADVMRFAKRHEGKDGVLCTSVFLVHPYLDLPGMGGGGLVITDNDMEKATALAEEIAMRFWQWRFDLDPEVFTPQQAIARGLAIEGGPILLVETADCSGGGAAGDSVATLKALLEANVSELCLAPVVDPEAAAQCHRAGVGQEITLELGHKLDPKWGTPLQVTGKVLQLSDGKFTYSGGFWSGIEGDMGASAVVQIGAAQVLITTNATYDWADEQFASMGMDTRGAKFIVVKNPMNYRVGYAGVAKEAFMLDTPGPTPATLHGVQYSNVARPYYPADKDIRDLKPVVYRSINRSR
jgi:microcystin degradation protein MlrC